MEPTKSELKNIVNLLRSYGKRLLKGITEIQLKWIPENSAGRSILSYFAHILNAEIYWLIHMNDNTFEYVGKNVSIEEGLNLYKKLQDYLCNKINDAKVEELQIQRPKFEKDYIIQKGSLGWMIWRTSMHSVHHFAQIAYIRHTLGNPPDEDEESGWSQVMDDIVAIAHGGKC